VLASGGHDKTVKLWDVAAGKETKALTGHAGEVDCVAFSGGRPGSSPRAAGAARGGAR
jgi:WD40 repeat protein